MWLLYAWYRRRRPVPVSLTRLRSARLDFCLGIWLPPRGMAPGSPRLFRGQDHRHVAALELRVLLDLGDVLQLVGDAVEHRAPQVDVGHLPAPVHHRHLDLVAVLQELPRVARLEGEVMIVDPRPVFHFLEVDDVLLFLRRPRRLRLLELELPVVHYLRDT